MNTVATRILVFVKIVTSSVVTFFPLLVLISVRLDVFYGFLPIGIFFFALQTVFGWKNRFRFSIFPGFFGVVLGLTALMIDDRTVFLWYPVLVNIALLAIFGFSLLRGPSMIERFARLTRKDLPEKAVRYTRKVTVLWCGFFILNGLIAFRTVICGNLEIWALWNGAISYLLIGVLLLGEYVWRKRVLHV